MSYTRTFQYQKECATAPILSSATAGLIFTAFDMARNTVSISSAPRTVAMYGAFIYVYNIAQCPMEAIHGRQSSIHNVISAGTLGYLGTQHGRLGIPFIDPYFFYRYPQISPAGMAFLVYGGVAGLLASLGGKRV